MSEEVAVDNAVVDHAVVVDAKAFKSMVKSLKKNFTELLKLHKELSKLPPGGVLPLKEPLADGTTELSMQRFKSVYVAAYNRKMTDLGRIFSVSIKAKRQANRNPYGGFNRPAFFTDTMRNFVADFLKHDAKKLDSYIPGFSESFPLLLESGISSASTLGSFLNIYAKVRNLVALASVNKGKDPSDMDKTRMGADDLMKKHFSKSFEALNKTDKELDAKAGQKIDQRPRTKDEVIHPLDINNFEHSAFQSLVSLHKRNVKGSTTRKREAVDANTGHVEDVFATPIPIEPALNQNEVELLAKAYNGDPLAEQKQALYNALGAEMTKVSEFLEKFTGKKKKKRIVRVAPKAAEAAETEAEPSEE
jgi:hypothetical protein